MMRCGPFRVPAAVTASAATLEQENSEEAQIARDFIEKDPFHGMGSVYPGGWMLLARDDDTVVIGQREGRVGLGAVVQLVRREGGYKAVRMGGWHLELPDVSEQVEVCFTVGIRGNTVSVNWENNLGPDGTPDRINPRIEVAEGPDDVHFLLHTASGAPPETGPSFAVRRGRREATSFDLSAPLGGRALLNDQRIPPIVVIVVT